MLDCHAHVISDDAARYPAAPLSGHIDDGWQKDPVTAERLLREMDSNRVERAVLVQRGHVYGYDNRYVLDTIAKHPDRFAAVCTVNPAAPDAAQTLRRLVKEHGVKGIRFQLPLGQHQRDQVATYGNGWFAGPAALALWAEAVALGASVCVHFMRPNREQGLIELKKVMDRFPTATLIVDHVSNFAPEQGPPDYGVDAPLKALAAFPNVYMKVVTINLGRLATEKRPAGPVMQRVAQEFGARRILWGSDIGQSKEPYSEMVHLAREAVAPFAKAEQDLMLGGVTQQLYFT